LRSFATRAPQPFPPPHEWDRHVQARQQDAIEPARGGREQLCAPLRSWQAHRSALRQRVPSAPASACNRHAHRPKRSTTQAVFSGTKLRAAAVSGGHESGLRLPSARQRLGSYNVGQAAPQEAANGERDGGAPRAVDAVDAAVR